MTFFSSPYFALKTLFIVSLCVAATPALAGSQLYQTAGNHTFTVPSGVTQIAVLAAGPGGDGGAAGQNIGGGGGGGGEAVNGQLIPVTPGQNIPITVGSGVTKNRTTLGTVLNLRAGSNASGVTPGSIFTPGNPGYEWVTLGECVPGLCFNPRGVGGTGGGPLPFVLDYYNGAVWGVCDIYTVSCTNPTTPNRGAGGFGGTMAYSFDANARFESVAGRGGDGTVEIHWMDPVYGTVNIFPNIAGASWVISGPQTLPGNVSGTFPNSVAGVYTITWNPVAGYVTPAPQTRTLAQNGAITFTGTYTPNPAASVNLQFR